MKILATILLLLSLHAFGQKLVWESVATNTDATFRGLSEADDRVAWVSGTKGTVGRSTDGGKTWAFAQVKGFEKADFRSLYAFDSLNAVIANAGIPAVILRTSDGGRNWGVVFRDEDTAIFFDGVDFWNKKDGMLYGDPIDGRMLLLSTKDGGHSWKKIPAKSCPALERGEASFAASGTGIRCEQDSRLIIVTGGMESRVFISEDKGSNWRFVRSPIVKGRSTAGIFSVACKGDTAIVVGGDYKQDTSGKDNAGILYFNKERFAWRTMLKPPRGYRECVTFISPGTLFAVGPTGIDISDDTGVNWQPFSNEKGLHVIRKSRKGKLVLAAGSAGKIGVLNGR